MKKAGLMRLMYGAMHGRFCGQCSHLTKEVTRGRWHYKCEAYGRSNSEATDWKVTAHACGFFSQPMPIGFVPVVQRPKQYRKLEEQLPGQIGMFEEGEGLDDHR